VEDLHIIGADLMRAMKIYWGGDNIIENDKKEIIKISTESII